MKTIKVYLQYPWKFPDSPYYKYLINSPLKEIEYLNIQKQKGVIINKKLFWFSNFLKRNIRRWTNKLNLLIPNAHLSPKGDYDLIHCAHCLSKNKDKPWVADVEGIWSLFISGHKTKKGIKKVENYLERENCKKILPWTEYTKKELLQIFPNLEHKTEVIYPAIPERKNLPKKPKNRINIIFSGRYFYHKGGLHALEAIDRLTKKYKNVYGIFNSTIPKEVLEKYKKNRKIEFYSLIPQEKLFELYEKSHILLYPGYSDSFGFAYLEAMSFGIPIVTVDKNYRREIVEKGTGFIINCENVYKLNRNKISEKEEQIIKKLVYETEKLIKDKKLREKMSKECIKVIKEGKFSIKERNKKLEKIYREALK